MANYSQSVSVVLVSQVQRAEEEEDILTLNNYLFSLYDEA